MHILFHVLCLSLMTEFAEPDLFLYSLLYFVCCIVLSSCQKKQKNKSMPMELFLNTALHEKLPFCQVTRTLSRSLK